MTATFASVSVVAPIYGQPFVLLARSDVATVAVLDLFTAQPAAGMVYDVHPFVFDTDGRASRVRVKRVRLFGQGQVTGGSVTFTPDLDAARGETYPITPASGHFAYQGVLVYQECSPMMVCRLLQVRYELNGVGVVLNDTEVEFSEVG